MRYKFGSTSACAFCFKRSRTLLAALMLTLGGIAGVPADSIADDAAPSSTFPNALSQPDFDVQDRLEILNLLATYSHLADGLHTDEFGEFFTPDAHFQIATFGDPPETPSQSLGTSRAEIVAALKPRHAQFRRDRVQRRHFLTNPIVWDQTDQSARVAVYLQLHSIRAGGPPSLVATGRYVGRVAKTLDGWRMAEWTLYTDQALE